MEVVENPKKGEKREKKKRDGIEEEGVGSGKNTVVTGKKRASKDKKEKKEKREREEGLEEEEMAGKIEETPEEEKECVADENVPVAEIVKEEEEEDVEDENAEGVVIVAAPPPDTSDPNEGAETATGSGAEKSAGKKKKKGAKEAAKDDGKTEGKIVVYEFVEIQLPPGWDMRFDKKTERHYFVDHNTRTTYWDPPKGTRTIGLVPDAQPERDDSDAEPENDAEEEKKDSVNPAALGARTGMPKKGILKVTNAYRVTSLLGGGETAADGNFQKRFGRLMLQSGNSGNAPASKINEQVRRSPGFILATTGNQQSQEAGHAFLSSSHGSDKSLDLDEVLGPVGDLAKDVIFALRMAVNMSYKMFIPEEGADEDFDYADEPIVQVRNPETGESVQVDDANSLTTEEQEIRLFHVTHSHIISRPASGYNMVVKDYAPECFHILRKKLGVNRHDYLEAWKAPKLHPHAAHKEKEKEKEKDIMILSSDEKLVLRTISHAEATTLFHLLPYYCRYVAANPCTLLLKFLGLHRVAKSDGENIYFVVTNNIFLPRTVVEECYDLKGSTVGRQVLVPGKTVDKKSTVLMDLDFARELVISDVAHFALTTQIEKDIQFLKSMRLMNYSFMVGIQRPPNGGDFLAEARNRLAKKKREEKDKKKVDTVTRSVSETNVIAIERSAAIPADYKCDEAALRESLRAHSVYETASVFIPPEDKPKRKHVTFVEESQDPHLENISSAKKKQVLATTPQKGSSSDLTSSKKGKKEEKDIDAAITPASLAAFSDTITTPEAETEFFSTPTSVRSVENEELFFFAIGDILNKYGAQKKFSNFFQSLKYGKEELTNVDPDFYARRFTRMIDRSLVPESRAYEISKSVSATWGTDSDDLLAQRGSETANDMFSDSARKRMAEIAHDGDASSKDSDEIDELFFDRHPSPALSGHGVSDDED